MKKHRSNCFSCFFNFQLDSLILPVRQLMTVRKQRGAVQWIFKRENILKRQSPMMAATRFRTEDISLVSFDQYLPMIRGFRLKSPHGLLFGPIKTEFNYS